jgi:hypothetical protein
MAANTTPAEDPVVRVFYSWQSDLPDETNRSAIRSALKSACLELESELAKEKLRLGPDEATRGESGSVNIPLTILKKIGQADIFIADITTINATSTVGRRTPNPNVVFELGYACAALGWERIILLFNEAHGALPADVPFDFDRHRISRFSLTVQDAANNGNDKATKQKSPLQKLLVTALRQILINKPVRPRDVAEKSPEEIKRGRDVANLKWLLSAIHQPTMQEMLSDVPHRLRDKALDFWEDFNSVITSSLFYLYDVKAKQLVDEVYKHWATIVSFGHRYDMSYHGQSFVFRSSMDDILSDEQQKDWDTIQESARQLACAVPALLDYVRQNYLEIDIEEMNSNAWRRYVNFHKEMDKLFEDDSQTGKKAGE